MPVVTINANRSVFIDANDPTGNYDSAPQIDVGEANTSTENRRGLIGFSVLSQAPQLAGATVTAVDLKMYETGSDLTNNTRTMRVARLKRVWVENQATWNVYSTGNSWSVAGASDTTNDREGTESGSISLPNPPGAAGYKTITFLPASVQGWIDGTFVDNGIILFMDTETDDMHRFDGSGDSNPPQLVITYTKPSSGNPLVFQGGGLALG